MAERRMFAREVTLDSRFTMLTTCARLLYYDLGMYADDDGIVDAMMVIRMTKSNKKHLFQLEDAGYISILDRTNFISYINDWKRNNLIKKDRYKKSVHANLLKQFQEKQTTESGTDPEPNSEPKRNPIGTQMEPQVRIGKDRIGKDRVGKYKKGDPEPEWNPPPEVPGIPDPDPTCRDESEREPFTEAEARAEKQQIANRIASMFGIYGSRALSEAEKNTFVKWVEAYRFSMAMIKAAYDEMIRSSGKYSYAYIDKILTSWHEAGYTDPEQALNASKPKGFRTGRKSAAVETARKPPGKTETEAMNLAWEIATGKDNMQKESTPEANLRDCGADK